MNKPMNINASEQCWQRGEKLAEHLTRTCDHAPSGSACTQCIAKVIAEEISAQSVEIAGGPRRAEFPPVCIGYPNCDGDLEGMDHVETCPSRSRRSGS